MLTSWWADSKTVFGSPIWSRFNGKNKLQYDCATTVYGWFVGCSVGCFHPGTRDNEPKLTNNNNNKALLAFYLSDHHYFALKKVPIWGNSILNLVFQCILSNIVINIGIGAGL